VAKVQINTHITPETYAELEEYCSVNKVSKAATIEEALRRFFAAEGVKENNQKIRTLRKGVDKVDR
jgi:hypothetical protein